MLLGGGGRGTIMIERGHVDCNSERWTGETVVNIHWSFVDELFDVRFMLW